MKEFYLQTCRARGVHFEQTVEYRGVKCVSAFNMENFVLMSLQIGKGAYTHMTKGWDLGFTNILQCIHKFSIG